MSLRAVSIWGVLDEAFVEAAEPRGFGMFHEV
jgi:hypothetical protein